MKILISGKNYSISSPTAGAMRIRAEDLPQGGLDRYGIFENNAENVLPPYDCTDSSVSVKDAAGNVLTTISIEYGSTGWSISCTLRDGEELYGLGDINRTRLDRRGYRYRVWVSDVKSYIPTPFLMSSEGWAIAINTTFEHFFDVGATEKSTLKVECAKAAPDFTVYTGKDYKELLFRYTAVSGRPLMLPRWALGLSFVCNTQANAYELVNDGLNFRREDIPCDVLGLEPGWMEKFYDETTEKNWSPERFYIPEYAQIGPHTFLGAVSRLKFKLSLWLCCDYDLTIHEEHRIGNLKAGRYEEPDELNTGGYETNTDNVAFEDDEHFHNFYRTADTVTKPDQPWFEHLKKFVDQGVSAFKMDGAFQVLDHPDRLYGNGMTDSEVHNMYPVLLARQMSHGFTEHTGRRSMIYTVAGYTGIQKYAATWAGDTGGGFGPMVSMLNNGLTGHSNTSCDLDVFSTESIHFGFLQPWSQVCSWNYWRHPWLLEEEDKDIFREYDKLRYSLLPYLYTAARQAYDTGMPMMRALPLVFPKDKHVHERISQYMLGDHLLVGSFLTKAEREVNGKKVNFYLPEGQWYDWFTGEKYEGNQEIFYTPPAGKGGALFVKAGAAIPMVKPGKYIADKKFDEILVKAWPDADGKACGTMYEDDGETMQYADGAFRRTDIRVDGNVITTKQEGTFEGMCDVRFVLD